MYSSTGMDTCTTPCTYRYPTGTSMYSILNMYVLIFVHPHACMGTCMDECLLSGDDAGVTEYGVQECRSAGHSVTPPSAFMHCGLPAAGCTSTRVPVPKYRNTSIIPVTCCIAIYSSIAIPVPVLCYRYCSMLPVLQY